MPISAISVPWVLFMIESLLLRYRLKSTLGSELGEFKVIILAVHEPQNPYLDKDGATASSA
jgi:hypothetical protein